MRAANSRKNTTASGSGQVYANVSPHIFSKSNGSCGGGSERFFGGVNDGADGSFGDSAGGSAGSIGGGGGSFSGNSAASAAAAMTPGTRQTSSSASRAAATAGVHQSMTAGAGVHNSMAASSDVQKNTTAGASVQKSTTAVVQKSMTSGAGVQKSMAAAASAVLEDSQAAETHSGGGDWQTSGGSYFQSHTDGLTPNGTLKRHRRISFFYKNKFVKSHECVANEK